MDQIFKNSFKIIIKSYFRISTTSILKNRNETALHDRRVKLYIKALKSSRSHQEENDLESLNLNFVPHIHPEIQHIWFGYWTFFTIQTPFKVWKQKIYGARSGESNYGLGTEIENIHYLATSSVSMCIVMEKMNNFLQFIWSFFFRHIWSTHQAVFLTIWPFWR